MAWFEKFPALLNKEEEALAKSGYEYKIDEPAKKDGRLVIYVKYQNPISKESETHELKCVYPAAYPYFPVAVYAPPTFPRGRHINPDDSRVCLYKEGTEWHPKSDCLASALDEQLPTILERHKNSAKPSLDEEQVGYQITGQMRYEPASKIFVDEIPIPNKRSYGELYLKLDKNLIDNYPLNGMIERIECDSDSIDMRNGVLESIYTKRHKGRWVKLHDLPKDISAQGLLKDAIAIYPSLKTPSYGKQGIDIIGLLVPEESEYRKLVYNWAFIARRKPSKTKGPIQSSSPIVSLIRSDRYTKENIQQRIPRLLDLQNKSVTVIGLGALGSQIAWQLARAGINKMTLIDCDFVQAGNIPRWIIGFPAIGYNKVDVVAGQLIDNFPGIQCRQIHMRIGLGEKVNLNGRLIDSHDFLFDMLKDTDCVVDAVAESNVSLYLSNICQEVETKYIWATGTQGAWGGIVGRIIPGETKGTWTSFSYKYASGEISPPPAEEGEDIQPVGCFSPTFTGAGFDLDHVSIMAARLAVSILCDSKSGYPDFDWDVAVLSLWDEETGLPIAPEWQTYKLD